MILRKLRVLAILPQNCRPCYLPAKIKELKVTETSFEADIDNFLTNYKEKSLTEPAGATESDEFAPFVGPAFNIAAFVNKSPTLKKFMDLGVDFHRIERRKGLGQFFLKLDFERDCKKHLMFLNDIGVPPDSFGKFITKNPLFFKENLGDLSVRVNYLESKKFNPEMISRVVEKNPFWLMFSTKRIDRRLGYFQKNFELSGNQVRQLTVKQPRIITYNVTHIDKSGFTVKEEMGFDKKEVKELLLDVPKIFMMSKKNLIFQKIQKLI